MAPPPVQQPCPRRMEQARHAHRSEAVSQQESLQRGQAQQVQQDQQAELSAVD